MTEPNEQKTKSGKGTFVVQIVGDENATWQGKITWTDCNRSMTFRSALEMMKLIDEAINIKE